MKLKITVHGVAYEVEVELLDAGEGFAPAGPLPAVSSAPRRGAPEAPAAAPARPATETAPSGGPGGSVTCPIAGTVVEIKCRAGDAVKEGQILLVVEAMKMNTSIAAPTSGTVKAVPVAVGDNVREGQVLVEYA
jgi:biotin carboxyl carrier protein